MASLIYAMPAYALLLHRCIMGNAEPFSKGISASFQLQVRVKFRLGKLIPAKPSTTEGIWALIDTFLLYCQGLCQFLLLAPKETLP